MNNISEVNHEGWKLVVNHETILVQKDGEHRIYDLNDIQDTLHNDEYVTLKKDDGGFYQVKFEEDNFLVIDEFDNEDEFVGSIGSHVFGEDDEPKKDFRSWTTHELADYLVDNELYEDIETALNSDRCDLLSECEDCEEEK
tara:strand:+ start:321 stop:743 length:423 start_codon:yes stop_codon:yes gene_type:complete